MRGRCTCGHRESAHRHRPWPQVCGATILVRHENGDTARPCPCRAYVADTWKPARAAGEGDT